MFPSVPDTRPAPPAPRGVPPFDPLHVHGSRAGRLRRVIRRQRRAMAAGLALASAALAASGLSASGTGTPGAGGGAVAGGVPSAPERRPVRLVSAPVRIADAATVRLLRAGDRVDVIAAQDGDPVARVVAKDVEVADVPHRSEDGGQGYPATDGDGGTAAEGGALVVLSVERDTATALAGAGVSGRLAVAVSHTERS
ncbi:RcpC/CpaB family pilus assembly protein [Streptomyces sp. NPDC001876]|uniref:RcpC/CpaB family pilus assembly protein n=1 Tax=Streptomyces sp. NPDC001876 TaxID=3154402 RepID=UPI003318EA95